RAPPRLRSVPTRRSSDLRRANGAVFLTGAAAGGPLERRAELEALAQELGEAETRRAAATTRLEGTLGALTAARRVSASPSSCARDRKSTRLNSSHVASSY